MIPDAAISLVKHFEGFRSKPYRDVAGYPTVGYGTLLSKDRTAPLPDIELTKEQAEELLKAAMLRDGAAVARLIKVPLNDNELSALMDWVYNLGAGRLQASTLRQKLNRGEYHDAAEELLKWCMAGGKKVRGLLLRRLAERALFLKD